MAGTLFDRDLVAIGDLGKKDIGEVLEHASRMLSIVEQGRRVDYLQNEIMATLFFEPSTRTTASVGFWILGSGRSPSRISPFPLNIAALMESHINS